MDSNLNSNKYDRHDPEITTGLETDMSVLHSDWTVIMCSFCQGPQKTE